VTLQNLERLTPIYDSERPVGSTADMRTWYTTKPAQLSPKSHISHVVGDAAWEGYVATVLEKRDEVLAYAKNDHLGFHIQYLWAGSSRRFIPDFLIRLASGEMLVLEVKGQDTPRDRAKRAALGEWVEAVSAAGVFGVWRHDVIFQPAEANDAISRNANPPRPTPDRVHKGGWSGGVQT
jgi:type III restriction enzyme